MKYQAFIIYHLSLLKYDIFLKLMNKFYKILKNICLTLIQFIIHLILKTTDFNFLVNLFMFSCLCSILTQLIIMYLTIIQFYSKNILIYFQ
jgi:hypothetical protein